MSIQSPSGVPRELPLSGMGRFSPNFGVIEHTSRCGALWQASAHKGLLGVAPVHRRTGSCGGLVPRSASQVADWLCMHVGGDAELPCPNVPAAPPWAAALLIHPAPRTGLEPPANAPPSIVHRTSPLPNTAISGHVSESWSVCLDQPGTLLIPLPIPLHTAQLKSLSRFGFGAGRGPVPRPTNLFSWVATEDTKLHLIL